MIDNHCENLDYYSGKAIMFNAHHNKHGYQHVRVYNWVQIWDLFEKEKLKDEFSL